MGKKRPEIRKEYVTILRPCFHFHGIQFKSFRAIQEFSESLDNMEAIVGIHSCTISLEEIFVCPDIKLKECQCKTKMEELVVNLLIDLEKQEMKNG